MALIDITKLAADGIFNQRVEAQLVSSAIAIFNEAANEVQSLSITGSPTGGSFTLASLPGSVVIAQNGSTILDVAVTGLSSTVGMWVGMSVAGSGIPAGTTIATITGLTSITLSAAATIVGVVSLTFSGTPVVSVPWNATAGAVQAAFQALPTIGNDDIVCTGGPLPGTPVSITYYGRFGSNPQQLITIGVNSLIGGVSPTPSVSRTTAGTVGQANHVKRAAFAARILTNPSGFTALMVIGVAADAAVQSAYIGGSGAQAAVTDAQIANAVSAMWNAYI